MSQGKLNYDAAKTDESAIPPHPPGFRLRRGRNWFFLGLLYAGYYLCRYNLGIVAPELKDEFDFNNQQYGGISSARDCRLCRRPVHQRPVHRRPGRQTGDGRGRDRDDPAQRRFGLTSLSGIAWMLIAFVVIRLFDGYMQAFGAGHGENQHQLVSAPRARPIRWNLRRNDSARRDRHRCAGQVPAAGLHHRRHRVSHSQAELALDVLRATGDPAGDPRARCGST